MSSCAYDYYIHFANKDFFISVCIYLKNITILFINKKPIGIHFISINKKYYKFKFIIVLLQSSDYYVF